MQTWQEQQEFFQGHWGAMKAAVESGGAAAAIEFINGFEDLEQRVLYIFARQGLVMGEWEGKNFDPYIGVCDAGVEEMVRQAEAAGDDETRRKRLNAAHILSYNLAADLADCWPGDDEPRTRAHFERGLRAAEDCLEWCPADQYSGLSMDWWAKGMHLLSLTEFPSAVESFNESLDFAVKAAAEASRPTTVSPRGDFAVILGAGYLGLARTLAGDPTGNTLYVEAVTAFGAQLEDSEKKDDAEFGISQLETVRGSFADRLGAEE